MAFILQKQNWQVYCKYIKYITVNVFLINYFSQITQVKKQNNDIYSTSEASVKRYLGVNKFRTVASKFINPSTDSQK